MKIDIISLITGGVVVILVGIIKKWLERKADTLLDKFFSFIGGSLAFFRFEKKYLKWIAKEHRYLKLVGIKREREGRPELEEIYVSLKVAPPLTKTKE